MHNTCFIYLLIDPRCGQIRYVGKTEFLNERYRYHIRDMKSKKKGYRVCWLKNLYTNNLMPILEVIDEVPKSEWEFWEKHYISLYKSWGFNLTNTTTGGEGGDTFSNNPNKEVINQKRVDSMKNNPKLKCSFCHRSFFNRHLIKFHNENCLLNPNITESQLKSRSPKSNQKGVKQKRGICFKCGGDFALPILSAKHNDKCTAEDRVCKNIDCKIIFHVSRGNNPRQFCSQRCSGKINATGHPSWCKGLTKENTLGLRIISEKLTNKKKSKVARKNMSKAKKGKISVAWANMTDLEKEIIKKKIGDSNRMIWAKKVN